MSRRALLTGGTGFVGSHLARRLSMDGWEVHALLRPRSDPRRLRAAAPEVRMHHVGAETQAVVNAVSAAAPEICWHLAAYACGVHALPDVDPLIEANVAFGARLVEGLAHAHVPVLVNAGTFWQHHGNETYSPTSLYAATKQAFEDIARYYTEIDAFRAVHLRLFDNYGPDDSRGKIVALLLQHARSGDALPMSPGEQLIDLVHINDVVEALLRAAAAAAAPSQTYQVATGNPLRLRDLAKTVEAVTGRTLFIEWGARPYRRGEMMDPWTTAATLPGWSPHISLVDGLRELWKEGSSSRSREQP